MSSSTGAKPTFSPTFNLSAAKGSKGSKGYGKGSDKGSDKHFLKKALKEIKELEAEKAGIKEALEQKDAEIEALKEDHKEAA